MINLKTGATLIELMLAIGLAATLAVPAGFLLSSMDRSLFNLNNQYNRDEFKAILVSRLRSSVLCIKTINSSIQPTKFDPANAMLNKGQYLNIDLGDKIALPNSTTPQKIKNYEVAFEYVKLKNAQRSGRDEATPGNIYYKGEVTLKADRYAKMGGQPQLIMMAEESLGYIEVSVEPNNTISKCQMYVMTNDACHQFGGVELANATPHCLRSPPCNPDQLFSGNDIDGNPICTTAPQNCGLNEGLVSDGQGLVVCKTFFQVWPIQ